MRKSLACLTALLVTATTFPALAAPEIGEPAPAFDVLDVDGDRVKLSDLKGKIVVMEWHNPECPFVVKHYSSGNMQQIQKTTQSQGVTWLTINSSAAGKQGYMDETKAKEIISQSRATPDHIILDPEGELGHLYDAKVTPHMYVIDEEGTLAYMGAIDSKPTADKEDIAGATNYITQAVASLKAGEKVEVSNTKPYGCNVKY